MSELDWKSFKALTPLDQVKWINEKLKSNQNITSKSIGVEIFNLGDSTVSKHLSRLGYEYSKKDNQYIKKKEEKSNQMTLEDDKSNQKEDKVIKSNQKNTLKMYADINERLVETDGAETVRATVKMAKTSSDKLDEFLKQHKILNKQDVISVAIEMFLEKYSN